MKPKQPKPGTQCAKLLEYFKPANTMNACTVRDIFIDLDINSPTKIISWLREMGWPIKDMWLRPKDKPPYKCYWLER